MAEQPPFEKLWSGVFACQMNIVRFLIASFTLQELFSFVKKEYSLIKRPC
jgi:hypothetical protein